MRVADIQVPGVARQQHHGVLEASAVQPVGHLFLIGEDAGFRLRIVLEQRGIEECGRPREGHADDRLHDPHGLQAVREFREPLLA
jgi:hypothetical protein